MSTINFVDRMQYKKRIQELEQEIEELKQCFEKEREQLSSENTYILNSSNYVDANYFVESQYIHSLKQQIISLIKQNDNLKVKNRELIEVIEELENAKS